MLSAALLLAASPVAADDYPAKQVLQSFATACSGIENMAVAQASAAAAGWEGYEASRDSMLGRLLAMGRAEIAKDPKTEYILGGTYQKTVADRSLHLVLTRVVDETVSANGCRIYDFAAKRSLTVAELEGWTVRPPNATEAPAAGLIRHIWNPGLKPGHVEMNISFTAKDSELSGNIPVTGLMFSAQSLEINGQ